MFVPISLKVRLKRSTLASLFGAKLTKKAKNENQTGIYVNFKRWLRTISKSQ